MLNIGMIVEGRYKVLRVLGRGGTGCVYLAENVRLHNYWAIKEVSKQAMGGMGVENQILLAESGILTRLRHPGLPTIVDIVDTKESVLIIMEYVEGVSLDKIIDRFGAQSERDVVNWGVQLCEVLEYLHSQVPPIIYRDMKPANIMLRPDGTVVLIDFGMARVYKKTGPRDTAFLGTYGYAAPEQHNGFQQTDCRTDVYGLGVTLYHLVTGRDPCQPPYGTQPIREVDPRLSYKLESIILKCTQLDPYNRYQSVSSLKADLLDDTSRETVPAARPVQQKQKTGKAAVAAAITIPIVLLLIAALLFTYFYIKGGTDIGKDTKEVVTDKAIVVKNTIRVTEPGNRPSYMYTPDKSGYYTFLSESDGDDISNYLSFFSDENGETLFSDNTMGLHSDINLQCYLVEGYTYHLEFGLYSQTEDYVKTGEFVIYIERKDG